jgi:hypothetical protein
VQHAQQFQRRRVFLKHRSQSHIAIILRFGIALELIAKAAEADDLRRQPDVLINKMNGLSTGKVGRRSLRYFRRK